MNHEIDLSKYRIRTDLAVEAIENSDAKSGIEEVVHEEEQIKITEITLDESIASSIQKKAGNYIKIEFKDVSDQHNRENVKQQFIKYFQKLLAKCQIQKDDSCLIVGLGNRKSTPDALGPLTIDQILVTNHLFLLDYPEEGFRPVSAITPGVMGETGIETSEMVESIIQTLKPDFVIVIDALASQSITRINTTIQMSNTGIHPGSGIGNSRKEISKETLGIPVLAIGIPTVVDAVTVVSDTLQFLQKFYSFQKDFSHNPMQKMVHGSMNYLKQNINVNEEEKKELFGILGSFNAEETKTLIHEVLTPVGYNLMVTPKEVDFVMNHLSDILGNGINQALHEKVNENV